MTLANSGNALWGVLLLYVISVNCNTGEANHRPIAQDYPVRRDTSSQEQPVYHGGNGYVPRGSIWQPKYLQWRLLRDDGPSWGGNPYNLESIQPEVPSPRPAQASDAVQSEDLINDAAVQYFQSSTYSVYEPDQSPKDVPQKKVDQATQYKTPVLNKLTTSYDPRLGGPDPDISQQKNPDVMSDIYYVVIVAGSSAAAIFGVVAAGYCFVRMQKNNKAAADVEYPAYGVTGPNKDQTSPNGDRRLAQSAQMYHYQHQKQQMIAVEKAGNARHTSTSDMDSEEENEEGDYTVYECPGLASTGEMEVKNPLFSDDATPASPSPIVRENEN